MVIRIQLVFHGRLNCFFFSSSFGVDVVAVWAIMFEHYVKQTNDANAYWWVYLERRDEERKLHRLSRGHTCLRAQPFCRVYGNVRIEIGASDEKQRFIHNTHTHTPISHSCQSQSKCTTQSNHRRTTLSSVACRMRVWEKIYGENPKVFKTDYSLAIKYHFVHYS